MEKDAKEMEEVRNVLPTLRSNELVQWSAEPEVEELRTKLNRKDEEITKREKTIFRCFVEDCGQLERLVLGDGGSGLVASEGSLDPADEGLQRRCEGWCRLQGVLKHDWSEKERDQQFKLLSDDWTCLWSILTHHLPSLKNLIGQIRSLVDIPEDLVRPCLSALDRVSVPDGAVATVLRRRSLMFFTHPGPVTRTDKKGEIKLKMMKASIFDDTPEIVSISLVHAQAPIDEGNLMRHHETKVAVMDHAASGGDGRKKKGGKSAPAVAAHATPGASPHILFTEYAVGVAEFAFVRNHRADFYGFDIPFNSQKAKLKLKDDKRKKAQGASVTLYRVRIRVQLTSEDLFEYDSHPFAIVTNVSQNAEGWISVFWERSFFDSGDDGGGRRGGGGGGGGEISGRYDSSGGGHCGIVIRAEMDVRQGVPWKEFFHHLSDFYLALTGRGLHSPASSSSSSSTSSFSSLSSSAYQDQEAGILEEIGKNRDDLVTFHEMTSLDFKRSKGSKGDEAKETVTTSRWQWIYSFIPLLNGKYGEIKHEKQAGRLFCRTASCSLLLYNECVARCVSLIKNVID